jgi:hypothetical protein
MTLKHTGEWRYTSVHSLTLALDGGEWSASHPSHFTPRERAPGTHCIGGLVGPRTIGEYMARLIKQSLSIVKKIETSCTHITLHWWSLGENQGEHIRVNNILKSQYNKIQETRLMVFLYGSSLYKGSLEALTSSPSSLFYMETSIITCTLHQWRWDGWSM